MILSSLVRALRTPVCRYVQPPAIAVALAVSFFTAVRSASAVTLRDPSAEMSAELNVPEAQICTIIPPQERVASSCEGLDVITMEEKIRAVNDRIAYFALLRFEDHASLVSVTTSEHAELVSSDQISRFVDAMRSEMAESTKVPVRVRGLNEGQVYDLMEINGASIVAILTELDVSSDDPTYGLSRTITYSLMGKHGITSLLFQGPPEHLPQMRAIADRTIRTVKIPAIPIKGFGRSREYFIGKVIGYLMFPVAAVITLLVVLNRGRRRPRSR